ncbi:universal stress protein [Methanohalobium sp.]|uniref:universal stress protein n=1 Tax=Methanohalobium sp. TaxID=2837493 RepID=UPI0025CCCE44|nr:universal stress protein [Methanohalobium sp.]
MNESNTIMVAFSATSIHKEPAKRALDMAQEKNAKLIVLSVRDKNITEKVAKVTQNHGFLGKEIVKDLMKDIKKDRDELISERLGRICEEAEKRGIDYETLQLKGDFVENVVEVAGKYGVDTVLVEDMGRKTDRLKTKLECEVIVV